MKNDNVTSVPNDTVVIICTVKKSIDDTYLINCEEVAFGKLDDYSTDFYCIDNKQTYESLEDNLYYLEEGKQYYCFEKNVDELKELYLDGETDEVVSINFLMSRYRADVVNSYNIINKDNDKYAIHSVPYAFINKNSSDPIKELNESFEPAKPVDKFEKFGAEYYNQKRSENFDPLKDRINLVDFYSYLKDRIIGNDIILKRIAKQIAMNLTAENPEEVKNILSIGPTGSGKSQTFKDIGKYLSIPVVFCNSTQLSAAGYVGDDVNDFLKKIYLAANKKISIANKSILVLDEIDKLKKSDLSMKEAAQDSLLKVIEGDTINVEIDKMYGTTVPLDTRTMTIVGCGAFSSIFEKRDKDKFKFPIGFLTPQEREAILKKWEEDHKDDNKYEVSREELVEYGFKSEFIPRFHLTNIFKPMDRDGIRLAYTQGLNSPLKMKIRRYLAQFNCELIYDDSFIEALTEKAFKMNCGGRGLDNTCEETFQDAEFDLYVANYENPGKKLTLKVTGKTVKDPMDFEIK